MKEGPQRCGLDRANWGLVPMTYAFVDDSVVAMLSDPGGVSRPERLRGGDRRQHRREEQRVLARQVTATVHGDAAAEGAIQASAAA